MATEKKKPVKTDAAKAESNRKIKVRMLEKEEKTLDELVKANLGLFIPLGNMSKKERAALEAFLNASKSEPIAMSLAAFAKDADEE